MDVGTTLEADPQSAELIKPAQRPFDDPAALAQSAAVFGVSVENGRGNAQDSQSHAMIVRVIRPIRVQQFRPGGPPPLDMDHPPVPIPVEWDSTARRSGEPLL